jgi:hypothetical protein
MLHGARVIAIGAAAPADSASASEEDGAPTWPVSPAVVWAQIITNATRTTPTDHGGAAAAGAIRSGLATVEQCVRVINFGAATPLGEKPTPTQEQMALMSDRKDGKAIQKVMQLVTGGWGPGYRHPPPLPLLSPPLGFAPTCRGVRPMLGQKGVEGFRFVAALIWKDAGDLKTALMEDTGTVASGVMYHAICSRFPLRDFERLLRQQVAGEGMWEDSSADVLNAILQVRLRMIAYAAVRIAAFGHAKQGDPSSAQTSALPAHNTLSRASDIRDAELLDWCGLEAGATHEQWMTAAVKLVRGSVWRGGGGGDGMHRTHLRG